MVEYFWHRIPHVEEEVVTAVLGYHTQLLHNHFAIREPRNKMVANEVL